MTQIVKGQEPTEVILRSGIQICGPGDFELLPMIEEIFYQNVYDPAGLPIETNDVVVDIGANIGVFTLYAASRTHGTVHAFEPFPRNVEYINQNIHANKLHNVDVHAVAVAAEIGSVKLFLSESSIGHLLFNHNIKGTLNKYIEVPSITLQHIMDNIVAKPVDFLKMDCEGSEGSILSSTPTEYLNRVTKTAIEFHDNVSTLDHNEIQRLLEEADFATTLKWDGKSPFGSIYGKKKHDQSSQ